ncbi:hypothetical protein B0J11DRAFT_242356 [Dendryphion nanum]|uniref:Yeast cell wall synthesis Kre9/Knh1-like N-terminal domain-containing protein n=1 Tax=Dendryphion nanum TaxID=256645 RepID=A0A9P9I5M1_9PLEO|nr:hypothetical protein B0J11DRAFT_242356 [Dendryphion nanum]
MWISKMRSHRAMISSNPITNMHPQNVQAGVPYTVEWTNTTRNAISIWLYKGPPTNVLPQFTLAVGIPNNGKAIVTIPKSVANSPGAGYGLQLRDDLTGQFQYTPQFGVIGAGETTVSSSASSSSQSGYQTGAPPTSKVSSSSSTKNGTASYSYTATVTASSHITIPTGSNSTLSVSRVPTLSSTTTRLPSSTTTGPAQSTGAAGVLKAGVALAAGVAGLVAALV